MKPVLQLKTSQQLSMTPQLQHAIRLLQLSSLDLRAEILATVEENPLLEMEEEEKNERQPTDQDPWGKTFRDTEQSLLETLNSTAFSLRDHLFWQMQLTPFTEKDRLIAATLIDGINDDGFLTSSLEDIVATLQPNVDAEVDEVEAVLHRIQQFDPLGVGARTLEECLSIQLHHVPAETPWHHQAQYLITHYLLLLGKHDYAALRQRLNLTVEELKDVIHLIQTLNPRPGTHIGDRPVEYVIPDIFTYKQQGKWVVALNTQAIPLLTINDYYAGIINKKTQAYANQQALRQKLQEAKWFLKSIRTRNETLLKVAKMIVLYQVGFLERGEAYMKPLILQDIANELGIHGSTVSRITTQKYLHTPRGTFELKYFFSGQLNDNNPYSPKAVQSLIKKLIQNENSYRPLSDNEMAQLLSQQGIPIARRTIAKYREAMNIDPSHKRRK